MRLLNIFDRGASPPPWKDCLWVGGGLCAVGYVGYTCYKYAGNYSSRRRVTVARQAKIKELSARLSEWKTHALRKISEDKARAITVLSFSELQKSLQDGELKPSEVLYAYQYQAALQNDKLNFVTEDVMQAEAIALQLDKLKGAKPPLYGIPFSLKENFAVGGYDATNGVSCFLNQPCEDDCSFIKIMKHHGAVPFLRTNLPQTTMTYDCHCPVFGATKNPHDLTRTPGGSSGGEGAAIGSGSSIVGFGGDLGGSIRIPSSWNGICGLKPCSQRISKLGFVEPAPGQTIVPFIPGPMGKDVDALVATSKALFSPYTFALDQTVTPIAFRDEVFESKRPLRIGYYEDLEPLPITASSRRALAQARGILEKNGHKIVDWSPPDIFNAIGDIYSVALQGDGGRTILEYIGDDEVSYTMQGAVKAYSTSKTVRNLIGAVMKPFVPPYWLKMLAAVGGCDTVYDWWNLAVAANKYRTEILKQWSELGIDAVLCPAMPCPAFKPGDPARCFGVLVYMMVWNLTNFPAGVVPVTKVTKEDLKETYPQKTAWDRVVAENLVGSEGLPMNVQCAAGPFNEEVVLRLLKEIETGLKA